MTEEIHIFLTRLISCLMDVCHTFALFNWISFYKGKEKNFYLRVSTHVGRRVMESNLGHIDGK